MAGSKSSARPPRDVSSGTLKRIVVGSSSKTSNISAHRQYRVRIGRKWHEGVFTKQWFGWNFESFGPSGMQFNLLDEVFELPRTRPLRWWARTPKPLV
jgi:hypothetical protein